MKKVVIKYYHKESLVLIYNNIKIGIIDIIKDIDIKML
jgi:hypothetical protein